MKVLCAENNQADLAQLECILNEAGYEITTASCAERAIPLFSNDFSCNFIDLSESFEKNTEVVSSSDSKSRERIFMIRMFLFSPAVSERPLRVPKEIVLAFSMSRSSDAKPRRAAAVCPVLTLKSAI